MNLLFTLFYGKTVYFTQKLVPLITNIPTICNKYLYTTLKYLRFWTKW